MYTSSYSDVLSLNMKKVVKISTSHPRMFFCQFHAGATAISISPPNKVSQIISFPLFSCQGLCEAPVCIEKGFVACKGVSRLLKQHYLPLLTIDAGPPLSIRFAFDFGHLKRYLFFIFPLSKSVLSPKAGIRQSIENESSRQIQRISSSSLQYHCRSAISTTRGCSSFFLVRDDA